MEPDHRGSSSAQFAVNQKKAGDPRAAVTCETGSKVALTFEGREYDLAGPPKHGTATFITIPFPAIIRNTVLAFRDPKPNALHDGTHMSALHNHMSAVPHMLSKRITLVCASLLKSGRMLNYIQDSACTAGRHRVASSAGRWRLLSRRSGTGRRCPSSPTYLAARTWVCSARRQSWWRRTCARGRTTTRR